MVNPNGTILVFGSPRSGTTWLAKILDSHPRTFYSHEPDSALPPPDVPLFLGPEDIERYREPLARWVERLKGLRAARITAKLPVFPKSYRNPVTQFLWRVGVMGSKAAPRALKDLPVPSWALRSTLEASPWLWKSIESLGRLGGLARTIPASRAILLVRHPCGVVSSILRGESKVQFTSEVPASEDRGIFQLLSETMEARSRGLSLEGFLKMSPIERLTWRWALTNEKAMNDTSTLPNVLLVRYEDLCDEPVAVSRRIFDFCGLEWHRQVQDFLTASVATERSAYYSVFKNPGQSARRWMSELPAAEVARVKDQAIQTAPGKLFLS
jgi:hypothetical protein